MEQLVARFTEENHTAAQWTAANYVLLAGQIGVEIDTRRLKIGDGVTAWVDLPYSTNSGIDYTAGAGILMENREISADLWYEVLPPQEE